MTARFPGVILSGGKSSRMGEPKALLSFGGGRLLDHVAARLRPQVAALALNANAPDISMAGIPSFPDVFSGFPGPLGGIHAALAHASRNWPEASHVVVVPVDSPFFPSDMVERLTLSLTGPDVVALVMSGGQLHPVVGLWPVSAVPDLLRWLESPPTLKVRAFLDGLSVRTTHFPPIRTPLEEVDPFFNINTPEDLNRARNLLEFIR